MWVMLGSTRVRCAESAFHATDNSLAVTWRHESTAQTSENGRVPCRTQLFNSVQTRSPSERVCFVPQTIRVRGR
jgi:hypothetical protein